MGRHNKSMMDLLKDPVMTLGDMDHETVARKLTGHRRTGFVRGVNYHRMYHNYLTRVERRWIIDCNCRRKEMKVESKYCFTASLWGYFATP